MKLQKLAWSGLLLSFISLSPLNLQAQDTEQKEAFQAMERYQAEALKVSRALKQRKRSKLR